MIILSIPVKTVSESNDHSHWTSKHKRHRIQKQAIWSAFKEGNVQVSTPCHIKLTRLAPGTLDSDNLSSALKFVRDTVASQIIPGLAPGRADDDKLITWDYSQEKNKEYAIRIEIYDVPF